MKGRFCFIFNYLNFILIFSRVAIGFVAEYIEAPSNFLVPYEPAFRVWVQDLRNWTESSLS